MPRLFILHLTTFLQGGAGRAIVDLACAQQAAGHQVIVVSSATGEAGYGNYPHDVDRLANAGVPLVLEDSLFKRDRALNRRVLDRLHADLPQSPVDVIHAHAGTPARIGLLLARRAGRRTPVIQTQHGWGTNKTPAQAREDLDVLRAVDRVVVTSEATRSLLIEQGIPAEHTHTIPCGIPDRTAGLPGEAEAALAPFRARGDQLVGCVGSVNANKNQRLLVEALARIAHGSRVHTPGPGRRRVHTAGLGRRVACVFIGEGGEDLQPLAAEMGVADRILALGYRPDAERWMPAFDLLAIPSFTEGQGLVVLEAFRAGVPVIASDIAPLRHLVTEGETGWLFDPHDATTLVSAIERALDVPSMERARITGRARCRFLEDYTADQMVERHDRLYYQHARSG
ncbi:MAG TPA: glycosyltransferase family 4 protein [Vicinamibacterales bacterium]|nr:glycosyltransferase family 4 protein [Vicinamibacterales bacterium]